MRHLILSTLVLIPVHAWAMTDFIAPGTPFTVGQGGAVLGTQPDHPVRAPRGVMETFGLFGSKSEHTYEGPRISRQDAKNRIEGAGYNHVIDLLDDGLGGWRGRAEKGGHATEVGCTGLGSVSVVED